jgi:hypothetical protein
MAWVVLQEGDARSSAMLCCDALRASDFGQLFPLNTLDTTAFVEYALGNIIRSAVIWGHTERLRLGMRSTVTSRSRLRYERTVPSARAALGDDAAFDAAWRRGAAMTTEQVVEFVLRPGDT